MIVRASYCRFCSIDKEDVRDLIFVDNYLVCTNCSNALLQVPVDGGPYHYMIGEGDLYD